MIKRLRIRFIVVSMLAVIIVLGLILGVINITNYQSVVTASDKMLDLISGNGGFMPGWTDSVSPPNSTGSGTSSSTDLSSDSSDSDSGSSGSTDTGSSGTSRTDPDGKKPTPFDNKSSHYPDGTFGPEAIYETRFFAVEFSDNGTVISTNTGSIAAVSEEKAVELAQQVYDSGKVKGFLDVYRYGVTETEGGKLVLFLNRSRELSSMHSFQRTSAGVALIGIFGVFLLILLLSRRAIAPVAESYEKQKRFITDASHELKTPLAIINSSTEVLELTQGESEWTSSIKSQVTRLSKLTNDLVALTRMDEAGEKLVKTDFSLSEAVREAVEPYKTLAESEGKSFSFVCSGNVSIRGNEDSIRKLAVILADNAVKYSDEKGAIAVCVKQAGRGAVIKVSNSVAQIEKGSHDEMFERFYRADSSRSSEKGGYGIGLSIAHSIVAAHRGKISAKSEDGKSLTIVVNL